MDRSLVNFCEDEHAATEKGKTQPNNLSLADSTLRLAKRREAAIYRRVDVSRTDRFETTLPFLHLHLCPPCFIIGTLSPYRATVKLCIQACALPNLARSLRIYSPLHHGLADMAICILTAQNWPELAVVSALYNKVDHR